MLLLTLTLLTVFLVLLTLVVLFFAYKLSKSRDASFFSNILVGHRGCKHPTFDIPENSIQAMLHALQHKADGIEIDIMLSADGHPIVFHDTNKMSRICCPKNSNQSMGNKEVGIPHMTLQQIQNDFQYLKGGKDAVVPTFDQFVDAMFTRDPTRVLMIEIKEYERSAEMAEKMIQAFKKYPFLYKQSVVASFNPVVLYMIRRRDPEIVTNFLFSKNFLAHWFQYNPKVQTYQDYPVFLENLHSSYYNGTASMPVQLLYYVFKKTIWAWDWLLYTSCITWIPDFIGAGVLGFESSIAKDLSFVRSLQKRGYKVNVWVVNTMQQKKELLSVGNIAITTDFLFDYSDCAKHVCSTYPLTSELQKEMGLDQSRSGTDIFVSN